MSTQQRPDVIGAGHLVADGGARVRRAVEPEIRERIQKKYAPLVREANWLKRLILRWRMEREVRAEIRRVAPDVAMYARLPGADREAHSA
jgi:hypothetical protein